MIALRFLLTAFAVVALAAPAPAQSLPRGGFFHYGGFGGFPIVVPPGLGAGPVTEQSGGEPPSQPGSGPVHQRRTARTHSVPSLLNLPATGETRFLPNEILVIFRDKTSAARIAAIAKRQRLELAQVRELPLIGVRVHRFRFAGNRKVKDVLTAIAREAQVISVEPHYVFALQEDATGTGPNPAPPSYSGSLLHLSEAHKLATGRGVRVAVIDSQIDFDHPEIDGSVAAHFTAFGDAKADPNPHGTGMASAIAGHRQIDGVAPAAQILAARVFDRDGGQGASLDVLAGVNWAVNQQAQVINMSFAGPHDPLMTQMLAAATQRKIVLVAAAGNDGPHPPPEFPAADPNVIAVSAIDAKDQIYDHASRGAYVALAAPGVDVLVAAPKGAYDLSTGTSVACAEVSGIAALLLEKRPDLDGPTLRRILRDSARPLEGETGVGAGAADAEAAVRLLDDGKSGH